MKMKYVKPEMAIENMEVETVICVSGVGVEETPADLSLGMSSKDRIDFDDEAVSSEGWGDGLW